MTPREIQNTLYDIGVSQTQIASMCNVSSAAVSRVISGESVSDKIRTRIAALIQRPVNEIWPGHLMDDGRPRRCGRPKRANA